MTGMDKSLLVEIFVDVGKAEGFIGTGYPVTKDLVITARHVVYPEDATPVEIKLRWYHQRGKFREKQVSDPACVVWDGGERFDVALIKCQFPVSGIGHLSSDKPTTAQQWESEGFAAVGTWDDDVCHPTAMQGEVFSAADSDDTFVLGTKYQVSTEEGWQGASGSPVFVNGRIIGIIKSCPKEFNATRFNATPIWKVLEEDKEFRKCVGYDKQREKQADAERRQQLTKSRRELCSVLECNQAIVNSLADYLDIPKESDKIADKLFTLYPEEALKALYEARHRLLALAKEEKTTGLKHIKDLVHILLPTIFDHGLVASARGRRKDFRYAVVELPIATKTVAEIIMAAVDMRRAKFRPLGKGEHLPAGEYLLPEQPRSGMDELEQRYADDTRLHLDKKFLTRFNNNRTYALEN